MGTDSRQKISAFEVGGWNARGKEAVMRHILVVDGCLRKTFGPVTLLNLIDQCLPEAEPHRRYVAALSAVANALSEPQERACSIFWSSTTIRWSAGLSRSILSVTIFK
jgi:hypothetical protein